MTWAGARESMADFGRVLSEYVDVVVVRTKSHDKLVELAQFCKCSVINGLTDYDHPCQALADLYTLRELSGTLAGQTLAFIGDGNNVARSLALGCGKSGMRFAIAAPKQYQFGDDFLAVLKRDVPDLDLLVTTDPHEAVRDASAIYTDVWTSMGQEAEASIRRQAFADYQVNARLMAQAPADAYFMHCLPAHRGEEVTDEVIDGPASIVVAQAANRLHAQKGILAWLLGGAGAGARVSSPQWGETVRNIAVSCATGFASDAPTFLSRAEQGGFRRFGSRLMLGWARAA